MKKNIYNHYRHRMSIGIGLIEAVAGVSIISIFIFSLMLASQLSQKIVGESVRNTQASFLLEEGADETRAGVPASAILPPEQTIIFLTTGRLGFPPSAMFILTGYLKENLF